MANDEVVDVLNDLLENARDGEYGFKTCAEQVEASNIKTLFMNRSQGCAEAARELEGLVRQYGGEQESLKSEGHRSGDPGPRQGAGVIRHQAGPLSRSFG